MKDLELRKKLSVLKSVSVPAGYWDSYWPRLKQRLAAAAPQRVQTPARWLVPAFALALPLLIGVYWLGGRAAQKNILRVPHIVLASERQDERAKRVFQEMLQLFPNRVNWISFVDGKVDFSISSVAYQDGQPLVPLSIIIPRGKRPFEARVLVRPGQDATAHAPWADNATIDLKWHLDASAKVIHINCRLTSPVLSASVEGDTALKPNQGIIIGALRWRSQLLQVQLTRLREAAKAPVPQPARKPQPESAPI